MMDSATILVVNTTNAKSSTFIAVLEALGSIVIPLAPIAPEEVSDYLSYAAVFIFEECLLQWSDEQRATFYRLTLEKRTPVVLLCHEYTEFINEVPPCFDIILYPLHPGLVRAKLKHLEACLHYRRQWFLGVVDSGALSETEEQEKEIALHLYQEKIEKSLAKIDCVAVQHSGSPFLNGELVLAATNPIGDVHLLVTQCSSQGLVAVIASLTLCDIFYSMVNKSFSPGIILHEINKKLRLLLPQHVLIRAAYVCQQERSSYLIWNGGLPTVGVLSGQTTTWMDTKAPPLASYEEDSFLPKIEILSLNDGEKILLSTCTIELKSWAKQQTQVLSEPNPSLERAFLRSNPAATSVVLSKHIGSSPLANASFPSKFPQQDWALTMVLGPHSLKSFDPLPFLSHMLLDCPELHDHKTALHTILSELYSNALEHGLLELNSAMKEDPQGIENYYHERQRRLDLIETGFIRLTWVFDPSAGGGGEVVIDIEDSGKGFNVSAFHQKVRDLDIYSGRGLDLVFGLCQTVSFNLKGNGVCARYRWNKGAP